MTDVERYLARWQDANLLDELTAANIRTYESSRATPSGRQWQVLVALILGGIMLGAGVLLFVAAHWDAVSTASRLMLVLVMLVFFHGLGLVTRERFSGLATAMHSVGTVSAGAAIALVGQIFNMQEHWPAAVLLWALCAAAGWVLLRDPFQQTLTLLLVPAWIVSEWAERTSAYAGSGIYVARMLMVIGVVYLVAFLRTRRRAVFGILFGAGAVVIPICVGVLSEGWNSAGYILWHNWGFVPMSARLGALGVVALTVLFGAWMDWRSVPPAVVTGGIAWALPWAQSIVNGGSGGDSWKHSEPNLLAYSMVASAAIFLVTWGVRHSSKALVNYGMVAFAMTVMWFYFSSVMDKLGRSIGLIGLGALFLAGGWMLEKTRRRLLSGMSGGIA